MGFTGCDGGCDVCHVNAKDLVSCRHVIEEDVLTGLDVFLDFVVGLEEGGKGWRGTGGRGEDGEVFVQYKSPEGLFT